MGAVPRLLVVDDEQVVCESCSRIFSEQGFQVQTVADPREGLRLAASPAPSVILLDVRLPGMDGIEFLRRLRRSNPDVPVIMITGYAAVDSAAAAMRLGAADYVAKPFTPDEITEAVRRVLPANAEPAAAQPAAAAGAAWVPGDGPRRWLDEAWWQAGGDGTVRAGARLPIAEVAGATALRLPAAGARVVRGLPLAAVETPRGMRLVPSPVTGEVLEANASLRASALCEADAWLARVRPADSKADLAASREEPGACPPAAFETDARPGPTRSIRRVRVTNRRGETVSLLATAGVLAERHGLGPSLVKALLAGNYPVQTSLGFEPLKPSEVAREAEDAARTLLLVPAKTGAVPANVLAVAPATPLLAAPLPGAAVVGVEEAGDGPLSFDARTNAALAAHLAALMTGAGR